MPCWRTRCASRRIPDASGPAARPSNPFALLSYGSAPTIFPAFGSSLSKIACTPGVFQPSLLIAAWLVKVMAASQSCP